MAKDNGARTSKSRQGQLSVVLETSVENVLFNSQISPGVESGVLFRGCSRTDDTFRGQWRHGHSRVRKRSFKLPS